MKFLRIGNTKGEVATILTIVTLVVMLAGGIIGATRSQLSSTSSQAATRANCGEDCPNGNRDCNTTDANLKIRLQCDMRVHKCVPVDNRQSCPNVTSRVNERKHDINGSCTTTADCKDGLTCTNRICTSPNPTASRQAPTAAVTMCNQPCTVNSLTGIDTCEPYGLTCYPTCLQNKTICPVSTLAGVCKGASQCPDPRSPGGGGGGGGLPATTPVPTIAETLPEGTAFRVTELPCKVEFQFKWDPTLLSMTLKSLDGTKVYNITNEKVLSVNPAGALGPIGREVVFPSGGSAGIFVSFDPTTRENILVTLNGGGGSVFQYQIRRPAPDWLTGEERYIVEITYKYKLAGVFKQAQQQGRSKECSIITPTVVTPTTVTPTTVTPTTVTPTTVTPTTITPTIVTPTVTDTPERCDLKVNFIIDNSSSVSEFNQKSNEIVARMKEYATNPAKNATIKVRYYSFNRVAELIKGYTDVTSLNNVTIPKKNWTNIEEGLRIGVDPSANLNLLFTDGVPTVLDISRSGGPSYENNNQCTYAFGGDTSFQRRGCKPCVLSGDTDSDCPTSTGNDGYPLYTYSNDLKKYVPSKECEAVVNTCDGLASQYISLSKSNKVDASFAYGNAQMNFLKDVTKDSSNVYNSVESFVPNVDKIFDSACSKALQFKGQRDGSSGPSRGTLMSSFSIQNESAKTITSVHVEACNASDQCVSKNQMVQVNPSQEGRFSNNIGQLGQLVGINIANASSVKVRCAIGFADGTTQQCPEQSVAQPSGYLYSLSVQSTGGLRSQVNSYKQLTDFNKDGVTNSLDAILMLRSYGASDNTFDVVADGVVNSQDYSALQDNLGTSSR